MNSAAIRHRRDPARHPSFIRAAMLPLAAGLGSLVLSACLHCATPPPEPETIDFNRKPSTLAPLAETKEVQEKERIVTAVVSAIGGRRGWAREYDETAKDRQLPR